MNEIAVLARWPSVGRVKTRLFPVLGPERARTLHLAMLRDTLAAGQETPASRRRLLWGDPEPGEPDPIPDSDWVRGFQNGSGLGARLAAAFAEMRGPGLVLGSDAPEIRADHLRAAFDGLREADVTLGPTPDGGYYLVGLRKPAPELFTDVPWSSSEVLERTLERARALGLAVHTTPPLPDVDTPSDLERLVVRLQAPSAGLPRHTALALANFGLLDRA